MAKRAKNAANGGAANDGVEPMVIALAEQLGTFLGRVQKKADGWLENKALREQVGQIRDDATRLLNRVNRAAAEARASAAKKPANGRTMAGQPASPKPPQARRRAGSVRAPGKRHRKPPAEELFDPRLGEPMGKQMGQKNLTRGRRARS